MTGLLNYITPQNVMLNAELVCRPEG